MKTKTTKLQTIIALFTFFALAGMFTGCDSGDGNNTHTVTFNINGGTGTTPPAQTVSAGSHIILPNGSGITKSGYSFGGWNTNAAGTGDNFEGGYFFLVTRNVSLYARWIANNTQPVTHTVTFNSMGGTAVQAQQVPHGQTATRPANPARNGYTFANWYNAGMFTVFNFAAPITGNITVYARWTQNVYHTVTFNSNLGTAVPAQQVLQGQPANRPANPTRHDRVFINWYRDAAFTTVHNWASPITGNITLFANWRTASHTFNVGDIGPGGGRIFYRSVEGITMPDTNGVYHFFEVSPLSAAAQMRWMSGSSLFNPPPPHIASTSLNMGWGRINTALILAADPTAPAALFTRNYVANGRNDWFLPSHNELSFLFDTRDFVGWSTDGRIWSSSESSVTNARVLNPVNGMSLSTEKNRDHWVRPIRSF